MKDDRLPDILCPGLAVVFCGSAAGAVSAARGAYYAGPGNRFWPTLFAIGLAPRRLAPEEFFLLPQWGIGLTDVAKTASGADVDIPADAYDHARLAASIRAVRPRLLAFNGKKAAAMFFRVPTSRVAYGPAPPMPDFPAMRVLPSTSGAAAGFWDPKPWIALADEIY